jgi:hypothetical protein
MVKINKLLLGCAAGAMLAGGVANGMHTADMLGPMTCAERVHDRLFFGLGTATGAVSHGDWTRFLADVVTPRFPNGLTVLTAHGQWRAAGELVVTIEGARVVEIVHDDAPEADRHLAEVITIYKRRYQQRSVMLTRSRVQMCL